MSLGMSVGIQINVDFESDEQRDSLLHFINNRLLTAPTHTLASLSNTVKE